MNYKRESESCQGVQDSSLVAAPFFKEIEDLPLADVNMKASLRNDFKNKRINLKKKKRDIEKEVKFKKLQNKVKKERIIVPHSSGSSDQIPTSFISNMINNLKLMEESSVVNIVETLITLFFLRIRKSKIERVVLTLSYFIKIHLGTSYAEIFKKVLLGVDRKCLSPLKEWDFERLQNFVKDLVHNWTLARKNEAFGSIVALLSTCLAVCYGADKKIAWTVGSFSMFILEARNSCKGANSLVDALLKVGAYVINGIKEYGDKGDFSGFLYSDDQLAEFDFKVTDLQCKFSKIHPGNLERYHDIDENQFDNELQKTIVEGERLVLIFDGNTKKYIMDRVRILCKMHAEFIQFRAAGGLRIAPFAYVISGSSGLGKSSVNEILMRYILSVNKYNHQDAYICTVNTQDKYFSSYRSFVNGVIMDDFANENPEFVEESPCNTLLRFINNVPYYLNMAEVDMKGKVVAEPKVVGVTTNVSSLNADVYSNQPSSIVRRLKAHIHVKVKEEFRKENSIELDPEKVANAFGEDCIAPDIWLFNVYTINISAVDREPKMDYQEVKTHRDDRWKMEFVTWNGNPMENATLPELLLYLKDASKTHFVIQKSLVERSKLFNTDLHCEKCESFVSFCTCNNNVTSANASITEIQAVETLLNDAVIIPHSSCSEALAPLVEVSSVRDAFVLESQDFFHNVIRNREKGKIQSDLKSMLITWIIQGRSSLNDYYQHFVSRLDSELQYLLGILKIVAMKYLTKWKGILLEMMLPKQLEDSIVGDYMNLVARSSEVGIVTKVSKYVEHGIWLLLLSNVTSRNYTYSISKYCALGALAVSPFVVKPSDIIVKGFSTLLIWKQYFSEKVSKFSFYNRYNSEYILAPSLVLGSLAVMKTKELIRNTYLQSAFVLSTTFIASHCIMAYRKSAIEGHECPRSVSRAILRYKEDNCISTNLFFPPALMIAGTVYNWDNFFSFYEDVWNARYIQPQSILDPTPSEVLVRDTKKKFDEQWFKTQAEGYLDPLPASAIYTASEIRNAVQENLWHVTNVNKNNKSNALVVCSGFIIVPWHLIVSMKGEPACMKFVRHNRGNHGNRSFETILEPGQCDRIGVHDLALCWVPKTGDVKNLIPFFPLHHNVTFDFRTGRIATRYEDGELRWSDINRLRFTKNAKSDTKFGTPFPGATYFWQHAVPGTCISTLITDDKKATISGLHIGGCTDIEDCGWYLSNASTPIQSEIMQSKFILQAYPTVIPMSDSGDFPLSVMGVSCLSREIKKKSCYIRHECESSVKFFGSSYNCNRAPKTKVRDTFIKDDVKLAFGIKEEWTSPKFKGPDGRSPYIPWEVGMAKWISNKPGLFFSSLNKAKTDYLSTLLQKFDKNKSFWISDINVLSWDQTVNGIPGKRFIDAMNFKTSIGFPFHGSKKLFSTDCGDTGEGWQHKRVLEERFILEAEKIEKLYLARKRYYPWYVSTLKDEPTESTKDKVRIFQASSTPFQLVVRKYTLPLCRFLQLNPLVSESAVGIDPCCQEWHEMFVYLRGMQSHCCDRWFAIDYKAYDTSISSQLILAVGRVYIDLARYAGYTENDIIILESIFTELAFSIVDFNGDILQLDGANPSGNPLTVFINGLSNSLLMRICFYHFYPNLKFSDHVRMMDYGDDLIASVRKTVPLFNMVSYADHLDVFGFTVTPADKQGVLQKYVSYKDIDFLKRKFEWSGDFNHYIGPLDEKSIFKSLCSYMSSDTDVELIVGSNIDGALDQWVFYGRKIYKARQKVLRQIVKKYNLSRFVSRIELTFDERVKLWLEKNASPAVMDKGRSMDTRDCNDNNQSRGFFGWGNIFSAKGNGGPPELSTQNSDSYKEFNGLNVTTTKINQSDNSTTTDEFERITGEVPDYTKYVIVPHSTDRMQLMGISDAQEDQIVDIPSSIDPTRTSRDSSMNSLGDFMSRPVQIYSGFWSPSVTFSANIFPWFEFVSQKRVSNRLNNFKLLRGRLRVKIMLNGNAFYYGRLMASYVPFYGPLDSMTAAAPPVNDTVQLSQLPRIFLDPTTSTGGEMSFPFFYHKDYISMIDSQGFKDLGLLHVRSLNPLKHTSGDNTIATKISVNIFAWMEDIQLDAPTQTNVGYITPQSSSDERGDEMGPISRLATAVEKVSIAAASVPSLAPFCVPAQVGAKLVRAGASAYGWSSPSLIPEPKLFLPKGVGNTAVTNVPDSSMKMTLDVKQEVSVDPRILGLGDKDEMDISYIASRETWLAYFDWPTTSDSKTLLYNIRVDPCLWVTSSGSPTPYHFAASCGATMPFKYWTGTFKLRLQVVASAFHRGRLMIVYDPVKTAAVYEENIAYSQIVDIATNKDVVFSVGPNQETTLMEHAYPGVTPIADMYGTIPLTEQNFGNGTIAIYVLNELTIPNSAGSINNDIQVNIFVSMGDDFEVFVPDKGYANYVIKPQSTGIADPVVPIEGYGGQEKQMDLATDLDSHLNLVYSGERIKSFRMLLKRYYAHGTINCLNSADTQNFAMDVFTHFMFPLYRGKVAGAVHSAVGPISYNYFNVTMLNWLAPAFCAWRGSIRWKLIPRVKYKSGPSRSTKSVALNHNASYTIGGYVEAPVGNNVSTNSRASYANNFGAPLTQERNNGTLLFSSQVNPNLEYEIPFYSNYRFVPGKMIDFNAAQMNGNAQKTGATITIDKDNQDQTRHYDHFVSAGEDFSFYFFTGWPRLYYEPVSSVPLPI